MYYLLASLFWFMKRYERGHAGIVFVLILPVLWGITAVCLDASRGLQTKVRLDEAVDSAVIAISADDAVDDVANKSVLNSYISSYVQDAEIIKAEPKVTTCPTDDDCFDYSASATVSVNTWFPGNDHIVGFEEFLDVSSGSLAQKHLGSNMRTSDILIAFDTSSSMWNPISGEGGKARRSALIETIDNLVEFLEEHNATTETHKSKLGFVPWSTGYTQDGCNITEMVEMGGSPPIWVDINLQATMDRLWEDKKGPDNCSKVTNWGVHTRNVVLDLTDDLSPLPDWVSSRNYDGRTYTLTGLIKAAKMLREGKSDKRVLIVISDGADSVREETSELVSRYGICEELKTTLGTDYDGNRKDVLFAFIGIDFHMYNHGWTYGCFGNEVYGASTANQLYGHIVDIITKEETPEVGHFIK